MGKTLTVLRFEQSLSLFNCSAGRLVQYKQSSLNVRRIPGGTEKPTLYSLLSVWEYVTSLYASALLKSKTELRYPKFISLFCLVVAQINPMKLASTVSLIRCTFISVIAVLSLLPSVQAQEVRKLKDNPIPQPIDPSAPNNLHPTGENSGLLSFDGGKRLMSEANNAVSSQNYPLAAKKLQEARQVFNQLSNFYEELNSSFSGIDNRVADAQRKKALDAAQMRDEATYQLALVHRAENQPELAVPLLVQIIKSQNPTRDLGKKAYQQLLELGFVDAPFSPGGARASGSSSKGGSNTPFPSSSPGSNNSSSSQKLK